MGQHNMTSQYCVRAKQGSLLGTSCLCHQAAVVHSLGSCVADIILSMELQHNTSGCNCLFTELTLQAAAVCPLNNFSS